MKKHTFLEAELMTVARAVYAGYSHVLLALAGLAVYGAPVRAQQVTGSPPVPGVLIDIGGQQLHLDCTGHGSPTVILENGAGDFSFVWALVQPGVARTTRVCSYDRAGYAWSEPGVRPRTYAQLALELHTTLVRAHVAGPYVLVGQSYGGLLVRGFAEQYPAEVSGMVLVDAFHEDQRIVMGGHAVRIRDFAKGRTAPPARIALDTAVLREAARATAPEVQLESPLDQLPAEAQRLWRWGAANPLYPLAQGAEMDWSPEELLRIHAERVKNRRSLGDLPLIVLSRTTSDFPAGPRTLDDTLEVERMGLQRDLAALSSRGVVRVAKQSGHNIHIEDPAFVIAAINDVVHAARRAPKD
jgi:pimeloyl-ACP methyl ester carboxylesterase